MEASPARVFIVRHGEREDHINRDWYLTADRPFDAILSADGHEMGKKLGRYLVKKRNLKDLSNVVFLSSPLQRCVQTSHRIIEGIFEATGASTDVKEIPIYIEHGIVEGPKWTNHDLKKGRKIKEDANIDLGDESALEPVVFGPPHFRTNISPFVQPHFFNNGHCLACARLYIDNVTRLICEKDEPAVKRVGSDLPHRCCLLAEAVEQHPALKDKTVFLVGHGETTMLTYKGFSVKHLDTVNPYYTGWVELIRKEKPSSEDDLWEHPEGHVPLSGPHLDEKN